jgi:calmodulin
LREVFRSIDVDGNDGISKEELIEAFYKRGVKMSWDEADELYRQADANGDGSISFDELMTIVELM